MGRSTNWGIFLGGGEENEKILTSAGLLSIPCPITENPPMLSQLGPKLENLMLILCKTFFSFKHFTIMKYNTLTIVTTVNPPSPLPPPNPRPPPRKNNLDQFVLQNYGALYFVLDMFMNVRHNYAF